MWRPPARLLLLVARLRLPRRVAPPGAVGDVEAAQVVAHRLEFIVNEAVARLLVEIELLAIIIELTVALAHLVRLDHRDVMVALSLGLVVRVGVGAEGAGGRVLGAPGARVAWLQAAERLGRAGRASARIRAAAPRRGLIAESRLVATLAPGQLVAAPRLHGRLEFGDEVAQMALAREGELVHFRLTDGARDEIEARFARRVVGHLGLLAHEQLAQRDHRRFVVHIGKMIHKLVSGRRARMRLLV